jgi:hypothetical protein
MDHDCRYDVSYDNYGINYAGIKADNSLDYYLIDNNGQILDNQQNLETGVKAVCIKSFAGKVYIIGNKLSTNEIFIYQKINGVSQMTFLSRFSPQGYTSGANSNVSIDAVFFNGNIFVSWFGSNYSLANFTYGAIGFLKFNPATLNITSYEPINKIFQLGDHIYYGHYLKMVTSTNKIHVVFSYGGENNDTLFMNRDISFNGDSPVYENWKGLKNWGTGLYGGTYSYDLETKGNITCTGDKLLFSANLYYYTGSEIIVDNRFKYKNINDDWNNIDVGQIVKQNITNYKKNPPLSFNATMQKGVLGYTNYLNMYFYSNVREFINEQSYLGDPRNIGTTNTINYTGGLSASTLQGDCFMYKSAISNDYFMSRRPNYIIGGILYNSLFTGNEYIGESENPICHTAGAKVIANSNSVTTITTNSQFIVDQGDGIEFKSGSTLNILENAQLIIDGSYASLKFNPNVNINLGTNAKIIIRNGAYLDANGATFSGINGTTWQGIDFDHSAGNNIKSCAFNNASTTLKFLCDPANETTNSNISDNTFNIPGAQTGSYTYGIYSQDMNYVGIGNNYFNMQQGNMSVGLCMKFTNSTSSSSSSAYYKILIYGNHFESGRIGMVLMSYASALKPYFIYNNFFNTTGSSIAEYGIATRKATGEIKNCTFSSYNTNSDLTITQSSLSLTNNTFGAIYNNINATASTVIGIAPGLTASEIILTGGFNVFNSSSSDNIMMGAGQTLDINNGYNCFQLHGSGKLHLNGGLDISETTYDAYNNYWNTQAPDYYLLNNQDPTQNITLNYSQLASCQTLSLSIHQIIDRGNGLFDTIYKSQKPTNVYVAPDEALYNQAYTYLNNSVYPTAILNFKSLIDGYTTSSYLSGALYDLYSTYESLDTSSNQGYKDNLYSDLKTYLTEKINSKNYDDDFNDIAYNLILMCETNMGNYNDALTGYQFIAMYHPDAIARLMASWDYTEVEALFNGMGGSDKETVSEDKYIFDLTNKLEGAIAKDSTLKSLKNQYLKETERRNAKISSVLNSNDLTSKDKAIEQKEKDDLLIRKSVNILMTSKNLSKEQKTQKQLDDIFLISSNKQQAKTDNTVTIPKEFTLSQNYPNPFNPTTKINYALPKTGLVTMKIYDVTGREIHTLVNDVKQAGNYSVDFNGSSLSSGVYFYKIQSGDFVMTKRMVLIK